MAKKIALILVMFLLLISTATAESLNLLAEPETSDYKITIEGSDIETIIVELNKEEINNIIQEVEPLSNWEKFTYILKKFDLPFDLVINVVGGYLKW